ncbi:uncharacterized protein LOC128662967 [Bombina bombina]|uniref:uncharacterized protein LOC128662967 n=1 Tax=Bombina bombina TaxID=8345 RepID=UPI00235B0D02|nr:uncharacterized protein LOC128662967 [Bombina bombina]
MPPVSCQCHLYEHIPTRSIYICVEDGYWGKNCKHWGSVGWNTGPGPRWGYKPKSALDRKDKNGKSLIDRMTLFKSGSCLSSGRSGFSMRLTFTIENPSPNDSGSYILSVWVSGGVGPSQGRFHIKDMVNSSEWGKIASALNDKTPTESQSQSQTMVAMADPSPRVTMATETGYSDINLWLEWMAFAAKQYNKSNCYVCDKARPHLGTVPLNIPSSAESCFLSLYTNTFVNQSACTTWKEKYPTLTKTPHPGEGITIYSGNYTCYRGKGEGRFLGNFTSNYCSKYSNLTTQNHTQSLGDIYWICGDMKICARLEGQWSGECALAKVIMPLHILGGNNTYTHAHPTSSHRTRREAIPGSFDPHIYIDAIGVPRGSQMNLRPVTRSKLDLNPSSPS